MSSFMEAFANPGATEQFTERMAQMKEDPTLKPILAEIDADPSAMMKYVMKFGLLSFLLQINLCVCEVC